MEKVQWYSMTKNNYLQKMTNHPPSPIPTSIIDPQAPGGKVSGIMIDHVLNTNRFLDYPNFSYVFDFSLLAICTV